MKHARSIFALAALGLAWAGNDWAASAAAPAATNPSVAAANERVVLDGNSLWRHFEVKDPTQVGIGHTSCISGREAGHLQGGSRSLC